jgi:hypothetical protein
MAYDKGTWTNEVLEGSAPVYTLKRYADNSIIDDDVLIEIKNVTTEGSLLSAAAMDNIETGIETLDLLFDVTTGHDHDGTDSKKIAYANLTGTPTFETNAANILADGTAAAGSSGKVADAGHVHPLDITDWISVSSLSNSWEIYGSPYGSAVRYRRIGRVVYLTGVVKNGTLGGAIFTLPSGFRPSNQIAVVSLATDLIARVEITTSGDVVPTLMPGGSTGYFSLCGVSFCLD